MKTYYFKQNAFIFVGVILNTDSKMNTPVTITLLGKVKVGVLGPIQLPGSYWDRSSALPSCWSDVVLVNHKATEDVYNCLCEIMTIVPQSQKLYI